MALGEMFPLHGRTRINGQIDAAKYVSARTGLTLTIADTPGPMASARICLGELNCRRINGSTLQPPRR